LTPYHFLTSTNFMDLPEVNPENEERVLRVTTTLELRKVCSSLQRLIALWWKRWKAEYIVALNKFQKWHYSNEVPEMGVAVIDECNDLKNKWKLGKIIKLYPGRDGIARTAKLHLTEAWMACRTDGHLSIMEREDVKSYASSGIFRYSI
ncbi:hypothetical protein T4B_1835, partial [Trichinella pseudospiralis]